MTSLFPQACSFSSRHKLPGPPALPLPIAPSSPSHHEDREGALPELPAGWLGAEVALSFLKNLFCGISTYFLSKVKGLLWGLTQGLTSMKRNPDKPGC